MNKWFASARDLSDSESSDSSEDEKKTTQTQQATVAGKKPIVAPKRNYMKNFDESSESEDEQRTVLTQKDKQLESLNTVIKDINNHLKINDFSALMQDFESFSAELQKDQDQSRGIIYEVGKDGVLPIQYLRLLIKIEDAINETSQQVKDKKLNLNKTNSVSLNKLKQKMKKYVQATGPANNTLENQITKFRENPVWSEDERKAVKAQQKKAEDAKKGSQLPAKKAVVETKKAPAKKAVAKDSDESSESEESEAEEDKEEEEEEESEYDDEEEEEEEEEESSEEEEIDIFKIPREQMTPAQRRLKWVKKDRLPQYLQDILNKKKVTKEVEKKKDKEVGEHKVEQISKAIAPTTEKEAKETVLDVKSNYSNIDFTKADNVYKKIKELQDERMRGKFDPKYHLQVLTFMLQQVKEVRQKVEITLNLLNSLFDSAKISTQSYMNREMWLITYDHLSSLLQLLDTQQMKESLKAYLQKETNKSGQSKTDGAAEEQETNVDENQNQISNAAEIEKSILPSLANYMEKLDLELLKAFQNTPYSKIEYLHRLRDENKFLTMIDQIIDFLLTHDDKSKASRVAIIKLDHLYYRNDLMYVKFANASTEDSNTPYSLKEDSNKVLQSLVDLINQHGTARMRIRSALYIVYHHSIHNRFKVAKDLLLKTHIADIISLQDIGTQIIYNRAITQIGMAAFRLGMIEDAHDILVDICQTAKLKEILAQGISRTPDKTIEMEREELKRQVPFHMHISLHQLDCIYMITAMLLEIPNVAENQYSVNKRIISKNFKKLIDQYDQKAFYLAAENYRDNLVFAAKELNRSNWKAAVSFIFSIKLIAKMTEFAKEDSVYRHILVNRFKEAALKAFLCRSARSYESFGLQSLATQFELEAPKLHQIISKMIVRNKIQAHFDKNRDILIMDAQSNEMKELQQLSLQYVDKVDLMIESNERIIDMIGDGKIYNYKERTANEIQVINANKRQKLLMKQTGGLPNVGQQTQNVIVQNPMMRR